MRFLVYCVQHCRSAVCMRAVTIVSVYLSVTLVLCVKTASLINYFFHVFLALFVMLDVVSEFGQGRIREH